MEQSRGSDYDTVPKRVPVYSHILTERDGERCLEPWLILFENTKSSLTISYFVVRV